MVTTKPNRFNNKFMNPDVVQDTTKLAESVGHDGCHGTTQINIVVHQAHSFVDNG